MAYRDKRRGKAVSRVVNQFGEVRPALTGEAPFLQLIGNGEATLIGAAGCE